MAQLCRQSHGAAPRFAFSLANQPSAAGCTAAALVGGIASASRMRASRPGRALAMLRVVLTAMVALGCAKWAGAQSVPGASLSTTGECVWTGNACAATLCGRSKFRPFQQCLASSPDASDVSATCTPGCEARELDKSGLTAAQRANADSLGTLCVPTGTNDGMPPFKLADVENRGDVCNTLATTSATIPQPGSDCFALFIETMEKMGCTGECKRGADVYLTRAGTCSSRTTLGTCTATTAPCGEGSSTVKASPSGGVVAARGGAVAALGGASAALAAAAVLVV